MVSIQDISDQVHIEKLKDVNNFKDKLLQTFTHELKTPINSILATSQVSLLPNIINNQEQIKNNLSVIKCNSLLLYYKILDILDYSQSQKQEEIEPTISQFNIKDVIEEIVQITQPLIQDKKLKLMIKYPAPFKKTQWLIYSDHNRLTQIILNLILNAIKFTFSGNIIIKLEPDLVS